MAKGADRSVPPGNSRSAPIAPNDRRRLHGSIAHDLAVAILGGIYPQGSILPNEDVFSQKLSVSRTAYREAIRILSAKGLVESRPKTGTRVTERGRWNVIDPDVLAWQFEVEPNATYLEQLYELRLIIEPRIAALAAERRTTEDLRRMQKALEMLAAHPLQSPEGERADLDFHHAIIVATRNDAFLALSPGIGATIRWSTRLRTFHPDNAPRDPLPIHFAVFNAIQDQDSNCAASQTDQMVRMSLAEFRRR